MLPSENSRKYSIFEAGENANNGLNLKNDVNLKHNVMDVDE